MRKAVVLTLGAMPGVAVGYFLLLAYIVNRVRPLPITFLPEIRQEPVANPTHRAQTPRAA